jgi:serine/threonine protein kinase/tetratricopeptide (TPR) repeat protein
MTDTVTAIADRYEIRDRVGMGGMGVVYEAFDRQRSVRVALKSLRQLNATALYRFKKEFRALCDLSHPNLVELFDLFGDNDEWFFTMELVEGTTFLKHVRPEFVKEAPPAAERLPVVVDGSEVTAELTAAPSHDSRPLFKAAAFDERRLRAAMRQLATGVCALHGAGKLHRDLKPSNVLVTSDGRVVICDFGLVRSVTSTEEHTSDDRLTGTPAYMSPEQAHNETLTEASDWYAVGVMLYEALTGRRPHVTNSLESLRARRTAPVLAPHYVVAGVPADLEELCLDLLRSRPEERPRGPDILARLGEDSSTSAVVLAVPFIGRDAELAALGAAADSAVDGGPVVALVTGASGLGKSALVRHFLEQFDDERALILQGRCYERESVPYKALDSLVDSLSTTLLGMPTDWLEKRLPADITALSRLFPVLRRVDLVAAPARRTFSTPDPQESRRRAFRAMRDLLTALAVDRRLVLFIDDVQWGDADSAALLAELLRPPDPPRMLLVLAYRPEEASSSSFLRVLDADKERPLRYRVARVSVGPMTPEDAQALASRLLLARKHADGAVAAKVADESRGNPFFVQELVHHAAGAEIPRAVALDDVLAERLDALPSDALALLRVLAVAGKPTELLVATSAATLGGQTAAAMATLRGHRLIRFRGIHHVMLEPYHDRIREVTIAKLTAAELREIHGRLARALEINGHDDPELLLEHRRGAGHLDEALRHAITAAQNATNMLAFDRAAALYRVALDMHRVTRGGHDASPKDRDDERALETHLGQALTNAGRGAEAAAAFLAAAKGAQVGDTLELERRAAEQLIFSGRVDEGLAVVRSVLAGVDMRLPRSPRSALVSLLIRRARIRLRGLGHRTRDASQLSPADLMKVDLCWSIAVGLGLTDNIRGTDFQTRHLLLALAAGEPYRIARALSLELAYSAAAGGAATKRVARLVEMSRELAEQVGHPHAVGLAVGTSATAAFLSGRWREARARYTEAEQIFRDRCTGVTWEKNTVHLFGLTASFMLGEIREISESLPGLLREAEERGDYYADVMLRVSRTNTAWLAVDDPDEAERQIDASIERWPRDRFFLPHYYELASRTAIDLYRGSPEAALARLEARLPQLHASYLDRVQRVRIEVRLAHAGCATATAARSPSDRRRLLAKATKLANAVLAERMPWATGAAHLVLARVSELSGDPERTARLFQLAARQLQDSDMSLYASVARRQHGELIAGDAGRQAVRESDAQLGAQGIRRPERFAEFLSPGRESAAL